MYTHTHTHITPHLLYPLMYQWTFGLFPYLGNCEKYISAIFKNCNSQATRTSLNRNVFCSFSVFTQASVRLSMPLFFVGKKRLIKGYKKLATQSCILTFLYLLLMQQQAWHMDPLPGHQLNTLLYKGWSMDQQHWSQLGAC